MMKKFMLFLMCLAFACQTAFAGHGTFEDGAYEGEAGSVNASTNLDSSTSGGVQTLTVTNSPVFTGDVTFRSTMLAVGRVGGASSISSSSTQIGDNLLAYSVILKSVGGGGGVDSTGVGTTLRDGTPGQMITFLIKGLQSGGSWVVTPTTKTGYTSFAMDTKGDMITLLFVDSTVGWIIVSNSGCVVTQPGWH
jgi:hypothetical protein